jgi:hypothetical protein
MLGRALVGSCVMGCLSYFAPEPPQEDLIPPTLQWTVQDTGAERLPLPASQVSVEGHRGAAYRVYLEAGDNRGLAEVSVSALGTFRCATKDGRVEAPFEVIVSLPTLRETYPITVGQPLRREAALTQGLALHRISCGRYALAPGQKPTTLYARSGTVLLRAAVRDHSGGRAEGSFRYTLR